MTPLLQKPSARAQSYSKRQDVSSQRAREVLDWKPRSTEEMIVAMADSMSAHGVVQPRT